MRVLLFCPRKIYSIKQMKKPKPSTREAHIRQKGAYGVQKFSGIIHMKRSLTTPYPTSVKTIKRKIDNCSPLCQKVINHLIKRFSFAIEQNKGDSKGIQLAPRCTQVYRSICIWRPTPTSWCRFKTDPVSFQA